MKTENKAYYFENELKFVQNLNVNIKWINIFFSHAVLGHKQVILYKLNINEFVLLTKWGITTIIRLFKQILSLETLKQSFSRDANFVIFFINRTKITLLYLKFAITSEFVIMTALCI